VKRVRLISGGAPRKDDPNPASWLRILRHWLLRYFDEQAPDLVIVGCAPGIDQFARDWCDTYGVDLLIGKAHWRTLKRPAGHRRNRTMALTGAAHMKAGDDVRLGAFPNAQSVGTWGMVECCEALSIPVDVLGPWKERGDGESSG
jgi:hypothetical protein